MITRSALNKTAHVFIFLFFTSSIFAQIFRFQTGDLLFQKGISSELNEAITETTFIENGICYTHVGIVSVENDTVFVIEATPPEVRKTLLDTFLQRSTFFDGKPVVAVGRLKQEYNETIPQAITIAIHLLGKPYDFVYSPNNDAYYCSELVMLSFLNRQGEPIFEPLNMNFRDADGNLSVYWIEHFEKHNAVIPENHQGSNPCDISKSDNIEIVYWYY